MMRRVVMLAALLVGLTAQLGWADAPERSLRPFPRPEGDTTQPDPEVARLAVEQIRPRRRAAHQAGATTPAAPERVILATSGTAVLRSIRPEVRPENLRRLNVVQASGMRTQPAPIITKGTKGALCGIKGIEGVKLAPIPGRLQGCGVADPVRVVSVDGVSLSTPAIMDCPTASALNAWVAKGVKPSIGRLGGGVAGLQVAAHYACRGRNSAKGAKISEHGKGHAIDISAIVLKNGAALSVLKGWRDPAQGKVLKAMHRSACGPFGTVLGPDANKFHQDHFHFDTARYRSGSYCR